MCPAPHFPKEKYSSPPAASLDYQNMLMHAPVGCFQSTPEGKFIFVNHAMASIHGYDSTESMLESITDIASQLYADPAARGRIKRLLELHGEVVNHECRIIRRDGSEIWVSLNIRAVTGSDGRIACWHGFVSDITPRKQSEKMLKEHHEKLGSLLKDIPAMICCFNPQGDITYINQQYCDYFGMPQEELLGSSFLV